MISSFGKTYHCTGWKIGYCIAPPALTAEFRKVHQYNTFCTLRPGAVGVRRDDRCSSRSITQSLAPSTRPSATISRSSWRARASRPLPVPGGYFQLVDYSAISDLPDAEFCRWLTVEKGVAAIPLSPFYESPPAGQRLVRLCFAKNPETLDAAIARLELI